MLLLIPEVNVLGMPKLIQIGCLRIIGLNCQTIGRRKHDLKHSSGIENRMTESLHYNLLLWRSITMVAEDSSSVASFYWW